MSDIELGPEKGAKLSTEEWAEEYRFQRAHPPIEGDFLRTMDGSRVRLEISLYTGEVPLIFARAFVPTIVGTPLTWYVQSENEHCPFGWKCILLKDSCEQVLKIGGLASNEFFVKELRVIRQSKSGKSLQVKVTEW